MTTAGKSDRRPDRLDKSDANQDTAKASTYQMLMVKLRNLPVLQARDQVGTQHSAVDYISIYSILFVAESH